MELTRAQQFLAQVGWPNRPSGVDNAAVQTCPLCANTNYKFAVHIGGEKDGLWQCVVCKESGNLYQLKERVGLSSANVVSIKDASSAKVTASAFPDLKAMHWRLTNDPSMADVLKYLTEERKFSLEVIKEFQLGCDASGEVKYYVIPYLDAANNPIFYKKRSVPPAPKGFKSPQGHEAPLYNERVIVPGMEELVILEGEADVLALLSQGYRNVVGVPGAGVKKAAWLEKLDRCAPKNIYLCYDNDKAGQEGAREMASRVGIDKAKNILLPQFPVPLPDSGVKPGKDLNEFFAVGRTLEDFNVLKESAVPFDVEGVYNVATLLQELEDDIEKKGLAPTYDTPWPSLTKRVGGFEPGDLVGIMAEGKVGKTTMALNMLDYYAEQGHQSLLFCVEMSPKRMVRKWVAMKTLTDDVAGASSITKETIHKALLMGADMPGDLLFGYSRSMRPEDIFATIRSSVRRYGIKVLCFDNLQLLVRSIEHSSTETSKLVQMFKEVAMELNILLILIIQPNRVGEGQIVAARNAMGSSAIEKAVDCMICAHRQRVAQVKQADFNGYLESDDTFEPHMLVRVDLSRYSSGGCTTLYIDGAKSKVREITPDLLKTLNQEHTQLVAA
jgi:KaiC/GvpD/RAD55 family RecA-like ATPase